MKYYILIKYIIIYLLYNIYYIYFFLYKVLTSSSTTIILSPLLYFANIIILYLPSEKELSYKKDLIILYRLSSIYIDYIETIKEVKINLPKINLYFQLITKKYNLLKI